MQIQLITTIVFSLMISKISGGKRGSSTISKIRVPDVDSINPRRHSSSDFGNSDGDPYKIPHFDVDAFRQRLRETEELIEKSKQFRESHFTPSPFTYSRYSRPTISPELQASIDDAIKNRYATSAPNPAFAKPVQNANPPPISHEVSPELEKLLDLIEQGKPIPIPFRKKVASPTDDCDEIEGQIPARELTKDENDEQKITGTLETEENLPSQNIPSVTKTPIIRIRRIFPTTSSTTAETSTTSTTEIPLTTPTTKTPFSLFDANEGQVFYPVYLPVGATCKLV